MEVVKFIEMNFDSSNYTYERAAKILLQLGREGYDDSFEFILEGDNTVGVLVAKSIDLLDEIEEVCESFIKNIPYTMKNGTVIIVEKVIY